MSEATPTVGATHGPTSGEDTRMSTDRTVADLVVERLVAWDVERIYGYAGDGNNPLLGALRRSDIATAYP